VIENFTASDTYLVMENNSLCFSHQLNDLDLNLNDISNILAYSVMSIGNLHILE
jgi:hypothetical protein